MLISIHFQEDDGCGRDRIVVSTLRCGRNNPGSNPGHGTKDSLSAAVDERQDVMETVNIIG